MNKIYFLSIVLCSVIYACDSDTATPPEACDTIVATYNTNVKDIIDQTCAYSGCHDGASIAPGDYGDYQGMIDIITNDKFANRVIDLADNPSLGMPPDMSIYPESQQDDLSPDQMEIIICWINAGYPE